jgi:hypothetical protein
MLTPDKIQIAFISTLSILKAQEFKLFQCDEYFIKFKEDKFIQGSEVPVAGLALNQSVWWS